MKEFYIFDTKRGAIGNCAVFWRPKAAGYTSMLGQAGRFSEAEVKGHPAYYDNRETTFAIECEKVDAIAYRAASFETLMRLKEGA